MRSKQCSLSLTLCILICERGRASCTAGDGTCHIRTAAAITILLRFAQHETLRHIFLAHIDSVNFLHVSACETAPSNRLACDSYSSPARPMSRMRASYAAPASCSYSKTQRLTRQSAYRNPQQASWHSRVAIILPGCKRAAVLLQDPKYGHYSSRPQPLLFAETLRMLLLLRAPGHPRSLSLPFSTRTTKETNCSRTTPACC